ncbi:MAG: GerMN domain-containing protein [Halothermotrichaceae bacterium]
MNKQKVLGIIVLIIGILLIYVFFNRFDKPDFTSEENQVKLYFSTKDAMYLDIEKREVDGANLYINTINELIKGPQSSQLNQTIPEGTEVLDIEVKDRIVRVSFNRALIENHWGGSTGETMTVYSIVNTLVQFNEIDKVLLLIEGKKIDTLAGHLFLEEPLTVNKDIIKNEK